MTPDDPPSAPDPSPADPRQAGAPGPVGAGTPFARGSGFNPGPGTRSLRRPDVPRRLRNGIKLRRREGIELLPWPAAPWAELLLAGIPDDVRAEGLDYARAGQAAALQLTPAGIEASVQGRSARPYAVSITTELLSGTDWDRVVSIMAREAVYSAKLLAGEMPPLVEQPFVAIGKDLVPADAVQVRRGCTCELPKPCKHVVCTAALVLERLAGDPLLAFTLRGLDGQRLLERLQEARSIATRGVARAHSTPPAVDSVPEAPPLDRCLANFWRPGRQLDEAPAETEPFAPHALLRRLGPSPLQGKFPLVGLLASIYDSAAAAGRALRESGGESSGDTDR